jgi:hypothetical protein
LAELDEPAETNTTEKAEDIALKQEEKRKKAGRRSRGPYRKLHIDW